MLPSLRTRLRNPSARLIDVVVTVVVGALNAMIIGPGGQRPTVSSVLLAVAATLPLLVRRRWPFAVLAAVLTAVLGTPLQLVVALYTIGANRSSKATIAAAAGAMVVIAPVYALRGDPTGVIPIALLCAISAGTGLYIGNKRTSITTLEGQTARLARERKLLAERAVAEERVRIAQELTT